MNLIFVVNSLTSGGAERVASVLANNFIKIGYGVTIISKAQKPSFYDIDKKVELIYPPIKINYKNRFITFLHRISVYSFIYKFLKKRKPNLVISFSTTTNGTTIPICKILGLKIIACEHTNYKANNNLPQRLIKRWIYPMTTILTVLTERDKTDFYGRFIKNVVVMNNPLPINPLDNYNSQNRENTILAIGSVFRWKIKGFDNLLRIFSLVAEKHPNWKLKIAGDGESEYLMSIIRNLKLEKNIELLGEVKEIENLMQKSSIFVLTSRWEGLPMALIEAMSQGMACISFNCFTGPAEIITHKKNGILIEDQNIHEFAKNLSYLINNKDLRFKLGNSAIAASKKYLPERIVADWTALIEKEK